MADDHDRFERIYRENFRAVLRFALARIDPERAKDVAAETFLVAWRRLDDVPAEPRPWLLGVARRAIAGQYRSESRREALTLRLRTAPGAVAGPDDLAEPLADRDRVLAAFATLGERDQEVLRLVTWDRLSVAEAAEVLDVTKLAFGVRLHRARRRLREELERADEQREIPPLNPRRHADAHR
jgi:RNA polymerase sigma-70 factor (ECF subfamily)